MNRESKAKHTQGEWKVGKTALNEFTSIWVGGIRIALVDEVPYEGSEANARLIAAAPAMLEMLQEIADKFDKDQHLLNVSPTKIKELIKKIEG